MKIAAVNTIFLLVLCLAGPGCFLFSDFKRETFVAGNGQRPIGLQVPKGYEKKELTTDSAGNKTLIFDYGGGQQLYFSTGNQLSTWIDTARHMPRPHLRGGIFYKGVIPHLQFWREVYSQGLRYGYRGVGREAEADFDSSLNYLRISR